MLQGFINIDKPAGITSFSVIKKLKPFFLGTKLGFVGTLDPIASGVLPVSIGFATRLTDEAHSSSKEYLAKGIFGKETDTYDSEGKIVKETSYDHIETKDLKVALESYKGKIKQSAPIFSALKVNGSRMYDLARKGILVEPKVREVDLFSIELINYSSPIFEIKISCGKGFYVRSLIHDIGKKLKSSSHMIELRRTQSGVFCIDSSWQISSIENKLSNNLMDDLVIPPEVVLNNHKIINVDDLGAEHILSGTAIKLNNKYKEGDKLGFFYNQSLIAVGLFNNNMATPKKVIKNV